MNWDMIAALAEIVGTMAIVISLLYVAREMKEATRQRKRESYHSILNEVDDFCRVVAQEQTTSDIWWRAGNGLENLTDAERLRYFAMLYILFRSWEKAFHYRKVGELDDWSSEVITKPMRDFTMSRGVQEYWALRKHWYTADFRDSVDRQMNEKSGRDLYGDNFRTLGRAEIQGGT